MIAAFQKFEKCLLCKGYIKTFFTPESVTLPVLSDVYCNAEDIKSRFIAYNGPFKNLVNDEKWQKGKMINFYPLNGAESFGYNPMDHSGPEQDLFNQVLVIPS